MRTAFVSVIVLVTGVMMAPVRARVGRGADGVQSLETVASDNTSPEDGFSDAAVEGDSDASPPKVYTTIMTRCSHAVIVKRCV